MACIPWTLRQTSFFWETWKSVSNSGLFRKDEFLRSASSDVKMGDERPFCGPSDRENDDQQWDFGKSRHHLNPQFEVSKAHGWFLASPATFQCASLCLVKDNMAIPKAYWRSARLMTVMRSAFLVFRSPKSCIGRSHLHQWNTQKFALGTSLQFRGSTFVFRGVTRNLSWQFEIPQSKIPVINFPISDKNSFSPRSVYQRINYQSIISRWNNTGWWLTYPFEKWWSSSVGMIIPNMMGKS